MKNFIVKVQPRGMLPYQLFVLAQNSVAALRIGLNTMPVIGSLSVRLA